MGELFDVVVAFFDHEAWPYTQLAERTVLRLSATSENGDWSCFAQVKEEQQQFIFYSVAPSNAPAERRTALAEFLTRANYGLVLGNFELDWDDGEIRFKTSIDVTGDRLSPALLTQVIYPNAYTMGRYLPGIRAVLTEDITPAEAIARIEG